MDPSTLRKQQLFKPKNKSGHMLKVGLDAKTDCLSM
jgi:hypothetical protein